MPTIGPFLKTFFKLLFRYSLQFLRRFGFNFFPAAVFWAKRIARSHKVLNLANTVVVERYWYHFWQKIHEESVKKLSFFVTNRDFTRLRPNSSFKIVFTDPCDMPIMSTRSLTVSRRFCSTKFLISWTWCSSVDVFGRFDTTFFSMLSLPLLKSLYHL